MASFETPEQFATYYKERIAYWTAKRDKFIAASKKARATRRIKHYEGKLEALKS